MAHSRQLGQRINELKTLRDELAVRIHLGEMEARDRLEALRPRIDEVEFQAERATDATLDAVLRTVDSLRSSLNELKTKVESKMH